MQKVREKKYQMLLTLRVSADEKNRLAEQADIAGVSVSEYMRRRFFGGRPLMARYDAMTIKELRRIGGLLKNNFETIRQAGGQAGGQEDRETLRACLEEQERALRTLTRTLERIGLAYRGQGHAP